ncbi:MAG TPA: OmpH family outer membrane protein [Longimicrobiales bacterium]
MRKIFMMTMASLAITASAAMAQAPAAASAGKIGYINSQLVLTQAPGAAEARSTIEKETNKHRADLALADDSIKTMITAFQQKQLAMSKDARDKQEADIRARQQALQQRADQLEQQMEKRQQDLIKPIMDKVNTALTELRTQGGYALILDTAAGAIVAADPALDLTDQVLAKLKAAAPTAATAPKKP